VLPSKGPGGTTVQAVGAAPLQVPSTWQDRSASPSLGGSPPSQAYVAVLG
jgi:hypothetical protein